MHYGQTAEWRNSFQLLRCQRQLSSYLFLLLISMRHLKVLWQQQIFSLKHSETSQELSPKFDPFFAAPSVGLVCVNFLRCRPPSHNGTRDSSLFRFIQGIQTRGQHLWDNCGMMQECQRAGFCTLDWIACSSNIREHQECRCCLPQELFLCGRIHSLPMILHREHTHLS